LPFGESEGLCVSFYSVCVVFFDDEVCARKVTGCKVGGLERGVCARAGVFATRSHAFARQTGKRRAARSFWGNELAATRSQIPTQTETMESSAAAREDASGQAAGAADVGSVDPRRGSLPKPRSPDETNSTLFVASLQAMDSFLAEQERLAMCLREAYLALSRAKYALLSSGGGGGGGTAGSSGSGGGGGTLVPLPPAPPPGQDEVRAERWVELMADGDGEGGGDGDRFELRVGPAPTRRRRQEGGEGDNDDDENDDPLSSPMPLPPAEAAARGDAARLRWATALPPPALRDAQARFGEALAAAVRAASAARAARRAAGKVAAAGGSMVDD